MKKFVLTRDMCPIHYSNDNGRSYAHFVCPLPLGYREIIAENLERLREGVDAIIKSVNEKALKREPPFQNILVEYRTRKEEDQLSLLPSFQIQDVGFNESRALYSVAIHGAYGDIYLDEKTIHNSDSAIFPFREFFEPNVAFHCHNVDYYWQALLTREVVVQYFNLLSSLAESKT